MKENKLVNYDSYYAIKNNLNAYYITYKIDPLQHVKKIHLKSIEIPICLNNVRSPYSTFYYTINNISYNFSLLDKTYISIYTLLIDLNAAIVIIVQPKLQNNEIAPIFTLSSSELNKIIMTTVTNSSILSFNSDGIMSFYLGYNANVKIVTSTVLLQKTNVYNFAIPYNLSLDTYYNLVFNNINTESKNNNNSQSDFKLQINSLSNSIFFYNSLSAFEQSVNIIDKNLTISKLDIIITDRFNNIINGYLDWSMTLLFEFY